MTPLVKNRPHPRSLSRRAREEQQLEAGKPMNPNAGSIIEARAEVAALVLTIAALFVVLGLHLLPALFAGLLVHELVHLLAPRAFGLGVHQGFI